jgi:4'-phosphopantetheinyl transferase EntD
MEADDLTPNDTGDEAGHKSPAGGRVRRAPVNEMFALTWPWHRNGVNLSFQTVLITFHAAHFDPTLFDRYAVECPATVANSVLKRQAEFFFGRLCAREALRRAGVSEGRVHIGSMRQPLWPAPMIGSISHNSTMAVAGVAPVTQLTGVGIDVEDVIPSKMHPALLGTVVCEREVDYLKNAAGPTRFEHLLTLAYSAKESFFKGTSSVVGRYFDFNAVEVERIDFERRTIIFQIKQTLCEQLREGGRCEIRYADIGERTVLTVYLWAK